MPEVICEMKCKLQFADKVEINIQLSQRMMRNMPERYF